MQILIPVVLIALMYVLLIRPQQQRARRQRELASALEVGDRILTVGGLLGTIVDMDGDTVEIEAADGIVLTFIRAAISRKLPPDEEFAADDMRTDDMRTDHTRSDDMRDDPPDDVTDDDTDEPNNHEEGAEA
jgi:preprotein translocase subunit YajC